MNGTVIAGLIAAIASVVVAYLAYKGGLRTAVASKDASLQTSQVDAQKSAIEAWQELLQPYRDEVATLHQRMDGMVNKHEAERNDLQGQVTELSDRVDRQAEQIKHWKRLARVIARWASTLRDEVLRLGGTIPSTPDELLVIQAIDDADDGPL